MDWKKTFNRGQWIIHGIFAISAFITIGTTIYALRLNHLQVSGEDRVLKVTGLMKHLREDNSFEKIGKYLSRAEADKAHDKVRELGSKLAEAEELLEIKSSQDLGLALRTFNKLINNNSGISNPGDALKVLNHKVLELIDVARSQNYKTVHYLGQRMKDRIAKLNGKNAGSSPLVNQLKSDLQKLEQTVVSSALTEGEKAPLISRLQGMNNEMELLTSLNSQSKDLRAHINHASIALAQWVLDAEKKAGDLRGILSRKQDFLILMMAGLIGFIITSWIGLAYLFRWQKAKLGEHVEMEVKAVIEKGIMADQRYMIDHYSDLTRNDIVKLLDELKVKLNLGTMLHEGLPFAGCMVDTSFKLTWFNHLFLDQFYLSEEEVRSDSFNWDYLREYLNLGEDPVYQALVNKIAGIYPVKVKQDEFTPMQPYEMYVTPITVNREDRVMIFFYPLISAKEAIVEQVNLARETLGRFIQLWNEERLSDDEIILLEKDFKNNDLNEMHKNLTELHERVAGEKKECIDTIMSLEKENENYHASMVAIRRLENERKAVIKQEFSLASDLRQSFISNIERGELLLQINKNILQQNDELKTEAQKLHQVTVESAKRCRETTEIMGQLDGVKVDYKKLKLELLEVKAKLISINTSLMGQLPPLDEHQQKLALRFKDELARLDFNVVTLDKKLSQLDVLLGKLHMMHDKNPSEQTNFKFLTSQKDHETKDALVEIQKSFNIDEGKIVEQFKSLHQLMRKDLSKINEATSETSSVSPEALLS